jgi:membrane protein implicated in regulation of membrane protease activity
MDLLSGILLTGVVLFVVVLLIKEIFGERAASLLASRSEKPSKPVNERLIGTVGKVVESTEGDDGLIKVRIGIERWNAKLSSADSRPLPVGTEVKVTAVNGLVLDVEENKLEWDPGYDYKAERSRD